MERAIKYLKRGLGEVQRISGANDFYDAPLLYLSGGLERFFKVMLCLRYNELHGRLPATNEAWKKGKGHDLVYLKAMVEGMCIPVTRPFAAMDYDIITKDKYTNTICEILGEFAKKARYFRLDAVLGVEQPYDAEKAWEKLETQLKKEVLGQDEYINLLMQPDKLDDLYEVSNRAIVIRIELFLRALCRQFIFGNFAKESTTYISIVDVFGEIEDEKLAMNNYNY